MRVQWVEIGAAAVAILMPASVSRAGDGRAGSVEARGASRTEIRMAVSRDGLAFREVEGVVLRGAAAPSIVRLQRGDLLAVFDYVGEGSEQKGTVPAATRSTDWGRSWSALKPIVLTGEGEPLVKPRHVALIRGDRGFVRMLLTHDRQVEGVKAGGASPTIAAASSRDGLRFRLDNQSCTPPIKATDLYPIVTELDRDLWLFAQAQDDDRHAKPREGKLSVFRRSSGSNFKPVGDRVPIDARFIGSVLASEGRLRAYVSTPEGVVSFVSKDARLWLKEDGVRIAGGWDPAIVELRGGSFLMLYCAPLRAKNAGEDALVAIDQSEFRRAVAVAESMSKGAEIRGDGPPSDATQVVVGNGPVPPAGVEGVEDAWAQRGASPSSMNGDDLTGSRGRDIDGSLDAAGFPVPAEVSFDSDGFAPVPDFVHRIDYAEHYRALLGHSPDDAYPYYARLMMDPDDQFERRPDWPEFNDMFNGGAHEGPPAPWSDEDHPEWAATSDEVADLLTGFRDAARHEGYATPVRFANNQPLNTPDGKPLLFEMMLPSLSAHRTLAKAILADAWRVGEDGRVSPDRMRDAIETTMRDGGHMTQGGTIIEHLVGVAERALTLDTARQALHQGVFSTEEEIAATLDVLLRYDDEDRDPARSLRFEHMAGMDAMQALFSPSGPEGELTLNTKLAEDIFAMANDGGESDEALLQMTGEDARKSAEVFDDYYHEMAEMWRTGYPEVRAADMDELSQRSLSATPLTNGLLPALSRYYKLTTREETSRRATQLAYATELFHKRNGRWPASLGELPTEYGEKMRTDPFTGDYFGYRVDENGPRIYSLSENGTDDGGVHARRWDDEPVEGSDDHVFWPPQPR